MPSCLWFEVKKAEIFSIGIDETRVSIVLRYVDSTGEIQERLLRMEHVSSTNAEALLDLVKVVFDRFGLELTNLMGQFYNGASNMSGQFNGLQTKIREINSSALYVHSYAHSLNLVLVQSISQNQASRNFFGVIQALYNFIAGSSKRHGIPRNAERGISTPVTLKTLSDAAVGHVTSMLFVALTLLCPQSWTPWKLWQTIELILELLQKPMDCSSLSIPSSLFCCSL